ncbi:MAG: chemotaxis protein CheW [Deltaproteobacteria bacterium]|nr:MAG: chemotaxis protein CheW [Deltaproteobacteria bacterium]
MDRTGKSDDPQGGGRILVVRLGEQRFGLPLDRIREVFELEQSPEPVPAAPEWLAGIVNHHGQVLPVLRGSDVLEAGCGECRFVVIMELGGETLGMLVEKIEQVSVQAGNAAEDAALEWHRGRPLVVLAPERLARAVESLASGLDQSARAR